MIIINRGRVTFYIKSDSIVVSNGEFQHSSYNTYALAKKSQFQKFKDTILKSEAPEFSSITDVVGLSSRCGVYPSNTKKPDLEGVEYEQRA